MIADLGALFTGSPGVVRLCAPELAGRIEGGEYGRVLVTWIASLAASIETVPPSLAATVQGLARRTGLDDEIVARVARRSA